MENKLRERLRRLPGVDAVAAALAGETPPASRVILVRMIRTVIEEARQSILDGSWEATKFGVRDERGLSAEGLANAVRHRFEDLERWSPGPVINATGVLVHTNLGRSPLSQAAVRQMTRVGSGYSDLEFDLESGGRGSRQDHVRDLLRLLCGADDALVVNNNAAAVLLMLAAVARGKDVVISRGELVEIGGSFRIPDVLSQSGAVLREVGTTNRTHPRDFEEAITPATGMLLKVHTSNYRIEGFAAAVELEELVGIGRKHGVSVGVDLGSGALLDVGAAGLTPEPVVADIVAAGPDLVTFSGDKLLGGPQAGIVVGKAEAIAKLRSHPLARAVRIDKLLLAGLQATLVAYLQPERARAEVPVLRMMFEPASSVRERADRLASRLRERWPVSPPGIEVVETVVPVGGGSLPGEGLASAAVALDPGSRTTAARWERALRQGAVPLLGRIQDERLILDLRTVTADEEGSLPDLVDQAWKATAAQGA